MVKFTSVRSGGWWRSGFRTFPVPVAPPWIHQFILCSLKVTTYLTVITMVNVTWVWTSHRWDCTGYPLLVLASLAPHVCGAGIVFSWFWRIPKYLFFLFILWSNKYNLLLIILGASLMAQQINNLPAMQETQEMQVQCLSQEYPLEEENGNPFQYSCLKNPMDKRATAVGYSPKGQKETQLSD